MFCHLRISLTKGIRGESIEKELPTKSMNSSQPLLVERGMREMMVISERAKMAPRIEKKVAL